ncbi:ALS_1a_G0040100.mRNA.1.CDS.1 [Saccharomyces cerevisiae]|nr:ALS_1a_G0040100.mRNA.1.CDS.1 [Saccharomyces cerevisiae]CAI6832352.1 ALS_1a_G0040100.mRNA.1.CDS.1 [Saccharomyces cerevisiae]
MNDIVWNKYKFHVILSKLMSDCTSVIQHPQLFHILENIKRSEDFMAENFPTSSIYQPFMKRNQMRSKLAKVRFSMSWIFKKLKYFLQILWEFQCILKASRVDI